MRPCKKCANEKTCRYCGIETSGCPHYLPAENNWIPVTKGLPEESGKYLATGCNGFIHLLGYSSKHKLFNSHDSFSSDDAHKNAISVLAWMPLPEPYNPED